MRKFQLISKIDKPCLLVLLFWLLYINDMYFSYVVLWHIEKEIIMRIKKIEI